MTDNFTTNLNLDKPVVGGSANSWGGSWNNNADALDAMLAGAIYGLTLSAAGSTATFGIAAGGASGMALASAYTKTASNWAVGTGNGGLDTSTIANTTWYHVWLIQRVDTGVVDVLFSLSATAPTLPANYTRKRRIGSMKTDSSAQWVKFIQYGDLFLWGTPAEDASAVTPGVTTATTVTLASVPTGVAVIAQFGLFLDGGAAAVNQYWSALSQTDVAATASGNITFGVSVGALTGGTTLNILTNTTGQIRQRMNSTTATYYVNTQGWVDPRGKF